MVGRVENYLIKNIRDKGAIHITLLDPENITASSASRLAEKAERCKTTAIMVGGSTSTSITHLDKIIKTVKRTVKLPVILFPNNVTGISKYADAIWFMSLLNSVDPYFLVGAQILGAPVIRKYGLETLPLGYIIVGEGGTVSVVGRAVPIPYNKPELAAIHALTAQYFGMRFVYLEAGSGASQPVPPNMIKNVKNAIDIPLIIGGGIKTGEQARTVVEAGADIVVTGNVIEKLRATSKLRELVSTVDNSKIRAHM